MEVTYKWSDSISWLSYHKRETACFWCPRWRISKNYSVDAMLSVLGDISVKSLPDVVSKAVGCKNFAKTRWDRCKMAPAYDAFVKIEWGTRVQALRGNLTLEGGMPRRSSRLKTYVMRLLHIETAYTAATASLSRRLE